MSTHTRCLKQKEQFLQQWRPLEPLLTPPGRNQPPSPPALKAACRHLRSLISRRKANLRGKPRDLTGRVALSTLETALQDVVLALRSRKKEDRVRYAGWARIRHYDLHYRKSYKI